MNKVSTTAILFLLALNLTIADEKANITAKYQEIAKKIIKEGNKDSSAHRLLSRMCDNFGPRISGSDNLDKAVHWVYEMMKKEGVENPKMEEVMVPYWKRESESCELISPRKKKMKMFALGGSISTPSSGIKSEVLVVRSKDELFKIKDKAKGKIVLFNVKFTNYSETVVYRWSGATWASECGAIASIIRSVSPHGMSNPHTGSMGYVDSVAKIPHGAITEEDADMLDRMQSDGITPVINLNIQASYQAEQKSYNVMSEIRGSEKPEEVIVMGGHIDSWDVGSGAQDDASGCFTAWHALRILHNLGLKPKRTIRVCFWTNEENGLRGGKKYAEDHKNEKHFGAYEIDGGVFPPSHWGFKGDSAIYKQILNYEPLLQLVDKNMKIDFGGGGADISPMIEQGVPQMSLATDDKGTYFWYHHSDTDTPDKINPFDLNQCAAATALAMYLYAELP